MNRSGVWQFLHLLFSSRECPCLRLTLHLHCSPACPRSPGTRTPRHARTGPSLIICCSTWPTWASDWVCWSPPPSHCTWSCSDCCWSRVQRARPCTQSRHPSFTCARPWIRPHFLKLEVEHCILFTWKNKKCHSNAQKQLYYLEIKYSKRDRSPKNEH